MSSACVCHTDEWCFYCEMYLPLEREFELKEAENAALKQEISTYKAWQPNAWENAQELDRLKQEIEQLKAGKAALLECVERIIAADSRKHDRNEHFTFEHAYGNALAKIYRCLSQIGGAQ